MATEINKGQAAADPRKSSIELITDLIKAAAWPLFAVAVLLIFLGPIRETARLLPDIVSRSNTIKIGDLTLEIARSISRPSEKVRQALAAMSANDVDLLLNITPDRWWLMADEGRAASKHLIELGLAQEMTDEELRTYKTKPTYGVTKTPLGEETRRFLSVIISEFTQQLGQSQ